MTAQLEELTSTYNQLCENSTQQVQQLEQTLAKEEKRKVVWEMEFQMVIRDMEDREHKCKCFELTANERLLNMLCS